MGEFAYTVGCTFRDASVMERWVAWLVDEHIADVCAAGAMSGEVVRLDGEPLGCEVRYRFASRDSFEAYERDHAPRLREEGLAKFPLSLGLEYSRRTGTVEGATS